MEIMYFFKNIFPVIVLVISGCIAIFVYFMPPPPPPPQNNFQFNTPNYEYKEKNIPLIKNSGNSLVCNAMSNVLGKEVKENERFNTDKGEMQVDCYDNNLKIAVDYKSEEEYKYEGESIYNKSILDFYIRNLISGIKDNFFASKGIKYVKVPYLVDKCYKLAGEYTCDTEVPKGLREMRMEDYLRESFLSQEIESF